MPAFAISDDFPPVNGEGIIVQLLAGCRFRVELPNKRIVMVRVRDKLRRRFIKLVVGDRVSVETRGNDTPEGEIISRL